MAQALATLEPVLPPDPHLLMPPGELESALQVADIMDGSLPRWHRDPPVYAASVDAVSVDEPSVDRASLDDMLDSPLRDAFEDMPAAAKREADGLLATLPTAAGRTAKTRFWPPA